jgi:hypothetical protein
MLRQASEQQTPTTRSKRRPSKLTSRMRKLNVASRTQAVIEAQD